MYTHTHIYTHPLNPLCTRNRHSFTAIPESNLLHSVHSHLAIVSHRSTDNNKILVLSVVYLRVYLFVVFYTAIFCAPFHRLFILYKLTTSIWSPCIVIRIPRSFYVRSPISLCTITGHKSTKYTRNQFFSKLVFLFLSLVFRWSHEESIGEGIFRKGIHEFFCFLES